ncbi:hypothetical protein BDV95DRAFT_605032 [Massariosphaeria phaeospora]|uniref:Uncharacterized protein n=1 Tax=Massariosphaeria phaeospora TaxID=100035 RepID=A0A7C8ICA7_9PLEO|nr:hypothetical protein BDV95DRAFT_605032 [Massariosphaeria phaeospora]
MSANHSTDPLTVAKQAERDLNSHEAKTGHAGSQSTTDSGIDTSATTNFPSATATYGSAASGAGDNREIPESEGGGLNARGQPTKARDFEGAGGPDDKARIRAADKGGEDDVAANVKR